MYDSGPIHIYLVLQELTHIMTSVQDHRYLVMQELTHILTSTQVIWLRASGCNFTIPKYQESKCSMGGIDLQLY